jgi:ankyrin repeat protein
VEEAIRQGADANDRDREVGATPLHLAAASRANPEAIRLPIVLGAEVNARDADGWTPLHWAAFLCSSSEIVLALLELGADHMARTAGKKTALDIMARNETLIHSRAFQRLYDLCFSQGLW